MEKTFQKTKQISFQKEKYNVKKRKKALGNLRKRGNLQKTKQNNNEKNWKQINFQKTKYN